MIIRFFLFISLMFCFLYGSAQQIRLSGIVRSAKDSSMLQSVSIQVKGSNKGTTTGATGAFSIEVNKNGILSFSSVGFQPQDIPVSGRSTITVFLMPDDKTQLGEVVVTTALGIKKQEKALGYAVQEVSGESLEKVKAPTVASQLTGKVAGLDIQNTTDLFQNPTILLRGVTPLIVIDGIPDPSADPFKINADDIESVTVLKGTAAGALYGSIGINGAIIYTTKKGKKRKLSVDVNSSTVFQTGYTVVPKVQAQYGDGDNGVYGYVDGSGSGSEGGGWVWGPKLNQKVAGTASGYLELPQYNSPYNPNQLYTVTLPNGQQVSSHYQPIPWVSRGANNIKNFFQTGILSTNSVAISAGSERGSFRMSASNTYQKGMVPNTGVENPSFTVGGNYALSSRLTVDTKLSFNRQFSNNYPTVGYGPPNILYNLILWIGPDIDIRDLKNYWIPGQEGLQQRNYNLSWYNNPYFIANQLLNGYRKTSTFGEATLDYQFTPELSLKFRNGFNEYGLNQDYEEPYSYIAYSYISKGNYSITETNYFDITSDLILNYKHRFSDKLGINITAGGSNAYTNYKSDYVTTDGLTIPGFYNLGNSTNPLKASNNLTESRLESLYGMIDLEALKFLYLSLTGRSDQTSTLPVAHNTYFYPSAGLSAVLSDVLKLPDYISFLKARASIAQVNAGASPYQYLTTYSIGSKWNSIPSLSYPTTANAPGLTPFTKLTQEYGLVFGFLKNRINLDATYFQNKEYNNIANVTQSQASGITSVLENANVYTRRGWEFMISASPIKTKDFRWETGINFANNHVWLKTATFGTDGYLGSIKQGQRIDKVFIDNSVTPNGTPIYSSNGFEAYDPYYHAIGNSDPAWIYGWQNTFSYKNFSLNLSFDGRLGGMIYSTTNQKMWWGGTSPGTVNKYRDDANNGNSTYVGQGVVVTSGAPTYDSHGNIVADNRKYAPNTTAVNYISFMQTTSGDMLNHYFYYSDTYLKLRELAITYTLPARLTRKVFSSATVSLIGSNLFILSKLPNVDPDAAADNLQTPSIRSLGVNFNAKF